MESELTKNQKRKVTINNVKLDGDKVDLIINLRYDDDCGNGHNSFAITGDIYKAGKRSDKNMIASGCVHDEIRKLAPEYAKYIKWHLMNSDKPMHYIANTIYHASKGNIDAARRSAIAPDATLEQLKSEEWLKARLPKLREDFKVAMQELGFKF